MKHPMDPNHWQPDPGGGRRRVTADDDLSNVFAGLVFLPALFAVLMIAAVWTAKGISPLVLTGFSAAIAALAGIQMIVFHRLSRREQDPDQGQET